MFLSKPSELENLRLAELKRFSRVSPQVLQIFSRSSPGVLKRFFSTQCVSRSHPEGLNWVPKGSP